MVDQWRFHSRLQRLPLSVPQAPNWALSVGNSAPTSAAMRYCNELCSRRMRASTASTTRSGTDGTACCASGIATASWVIVSASRLVTSRTGRRQPANSRTRCPPVMADRWLLAVDPQPHLFPGDEQGRGRDVIGGREGDDLVPVQESEVADVPVRVAHSDTQYDCARQCAQVGWSVGPVSGEQVGQSGQGGTVRVQALVLLAANGVHPQRSASVLLAQPYDGVSSHVAVETSHNQTRPAESLIVEFRGSLSFPSFDHFRANKGRLMDPLTLPLGVRRHGSGTLRMELTRRRPKRRRGGVAGRTGA